MRDPLDTFRGVLLGIGLSLVFWTVAVIAAVIAGWIG